MSSNDQGKRERLARVLASYRQNFDSSNVFAKAVGIPSGTFGTYLSADRFPTLENKLKIAKFLAKSREAPRSTRRVSVGMRASEPQANKPELWYNNRI